MKSHTISELVDLSTIQKLAEGHYQSTGMPVGIIDASDGSVLVATGWQDVCTSFHRAHPSSLRYCQESDNYVKGHLIDGEACQYRCKNGLWDIGVPVFVAKRHLATIFLGQFFYEGETPDRDYFIRQAQQYGYNLSEYLAALDRVPVFTKEKVDGIIAYNKSFSRFMAELAERSLSNFVAEQALRDSEYKFRVLTETSPAAIFLYQEEKIVYANPATARMLGFAKEELLETRLWDWLPSNLKDRVRQSDGSGPSPFDCKFTTKSGEERWGNVSTGWTDYQGNPAGIVIIHDITKIKEAEETQQRESALLRCVIDSVSDLIFIKDRDGVYLRCNKVSEKFIGLSESEQIGKTDFDFFDREKAEAIQKLDRQVLAEGKPLRIEEWVTDADGARILFDTLKAPYYGANGEVMGLVGISRDITDRKRAEEALRESEARYRRIVDTATEGIWMIGPDSMTTFVNARMTEILGCSGEEMIGRPFTDFMFEEDIPHHLLQIENRRRGIKGQYERRFRHREGRTVWTLASASSLLDEQRHFEGSFAMFTDITERKRMETELKESEARYRYSSNLLASILESAVSVSMYALDREYCYLAFNHRHREGAKRLWGADITVGMSILDAIDTCEHREFCRQGYDKVLEGRSYFIESREVISGDGRQTVEYRDNYGSPIYDDDGDVVGLTVFAIDSTERKRAEEEIRRLKNYLANIIDSMPSILVGMDRDEVVTQWNRQAADSTGISAAEAVGRTITQLFPDFSPWIAAMRSEIDKQRPASMEKLLIEKEGERRFYDMMLYPLISNGVEGAVVRIEDATERARVQELMIQTEKMMSVGGLAAGMAHEINNPLGIITQAVQNVERRVSPGLPANRKAAEELGVSLEEINAYFEKRQIPEFIGSIREASLRASRIIDNMLQFSRYSGTTMQPVSPAVIIEQALELAASDYDLKKKYDFRSIEIIRDYAPDMPEVPMVVVEMEQVMLNLLKNAAQSMSLNPPERRPRITLRLRREERYAVIEVEDNGPGMKEEVRRRAFEPFFTTKEPGIGTGLGLSVSYMIVTQNHKGLMEVESKPGKGACFRVRLPLLKESIHG
jgi:PAS domain S-box-containing protein